MKRSVPFKRTIVFLLAFMACAQFWSCKKGGDDSDPANASSQICSQITGTEAIYWDLMNGIPRTDIPGGLPTIAQAGGSFTHPTFPLLSFIYPVGYTPQKDETSGAVGVNLFRNDNRSIWRYTSIFVGGSVTPQQVVNNEVVSLRTFLGSTGNIETVCTQQGSQPRAAGITSDYASAFIRFDGFTATINVTNTVQSGLGAVQVNIMMTCAPTSEFSSEVLKTYLPIDYQLLYKNNGELDSDGDGFSDTIDNAPFDPNQH